MESDLMPEELKNPENWTLFDFDSVFAAFRDDHGVRLGALQPDDRPRLRPDDPRYARQAASRPPQPGEPRLSRKVRSRKWEPEVIDPICDQLVDEFKDDGEADLVKAVTFEFPTRVTAALLGLPQEDLEMFRRLSLDLISITEDIEAGLTASVELGTYFQDQVDQRRSTMTDDIIGDLVAAEIDGEKLTDEAIISFLRLLLPAGLETTYRSSSNLLQLLLTHPDQLEALQRDRDLIPAAIEEGIRYETPLVLVAAEHHPRRRDARHDRSRRAPRSTCVWARPIATNHVGPIPGVFDIHRPRRAHISFAGGIHSCLGMHLARVETKAMLNSLFDRVTDLQLRAPTTTPRSSGMPFRSPKHLPVTFRPRRMKSRAAILHDVGQPWSVEEFELDPPTRRRGARSRWRRRGCATPTSTSSTATCPHPTR